jgi:hypothetical protein
VGTIRRKGVTGRHAVYQCRWRGIAHSNDPQRAEPAAGPEFAAQFHIPLATRKDWEQGRRPKPAEWAYLQVIEGEPAVGP